MTDIQTYVNIDELRLFLGGNSENPPLYEFEDGKIPMEALYQHTWWRDRSGKPHKIDEMHPIHAQRAIRKLLGAFRFRSDVQLRYTPLWKALSVRAIHVG